MKLGKYRLSLTETLKDPFDVEVDVELPVASVPLGPLAAVVDAIKALLPRKDAFARKHPCNPAVNLVSAENYCAQKARLATEKHPENANPDPLNAAADIVRNIPRNKD